MMMVIAKVTALVMAMAMAMAKAMLFLVAMLVAMLMAMAIVCVLQICDTKGKRCHRFATRIAIRVRRL